MGFLRKIYKAITASFVVFVGILLGPNPLPKGAKFTEFDVTPFKNLGEGLAKNDLLNNAERLFEGEIKGPEGFEVINGELYTTLHGGFVAKVYDDQVIPVVKFGQPCVGWWEESKCGRPLGIKAYGRDHLVVADAYFGLHKFNIHTKQVVTLVDNSTVIDGKTPKIFNGVEVAKDGTIFWTHSSSDFTIQDGIYAFLADGSGRLMKYDPVTRTNVVLLKDLFFPNGLVLSPNEDYLLVAETGQSRILKFHLKGPKQYTSEVFLDGLPGVPDNLRRNGHEGFFVPLVMTADEKSPLVFQLVSNYPNLRKFAARFMSIIERGLEEIDKIYPSYYTKRAIHFVGHLESVGILFTAKTIVLVVDYNGKVVRSFHGSDGSVSSVSDVIPFDGFLWLGSPTNDYLARVALSKLGIKGDLKFESHAAHPPPPTARAPPPPTTRPPPPPTTRPPPPSTTRAPPPTTTRPPPPPTTRPPPPSTTKAPPPPPPPTRPPPPPTARAPPPPTTTQPPPTPQPRTTPKPPPRNPPTNQNQGQR